MPAYRPPAERFWEKVDKDGPIPVHRPELGPCWVWMAYLDHPGYGRFFDENHRAWKAHRWSYISRHGKIPEDKELDHLCRNRACVNDSHMEVVKHRVNVLRGESPLARNAKKTHCLRGHPLSGSNLHVLRTRYGFRRNCVICDDLRYKKRFGNLPTYRKGASQFPLTTEANLA
jgi:HNH endonuclease